MFTLSAKIVGKRIGYEGQRSLIINEGIYNSFGRLLVDPDYNISAVKSLTSANNGRNQTVDIFGSSGDDMDIIVQDFQLDHDVDENDWLFFPKMGAFSLGLSSETTSLKLPAKFGNFWLFCTEAPDMIDDAMEFHRDLRLDITIPDESYEVIFLDLEGSKEQYCLDLFEELPDHQFWEDLFNANR